MNCDWVAERIIALTADALSTDDRDACMIHIEYCADCKDALEGARALQRFRAQHVPATPGGTFERTMNRTLEEKPEQATGSKFWLGATFGGAIAASLIVTAISFGLLVTPLTIDTERPEFLVALDESRPMHIAIEADKSLAGAKISILLAGDVKLEGFGDHRELSWNEDLAAGVNKLTLPLIATGLGGGQMIVSLSHPEREQLFVIQLKSES